MNDGETGEVKDDKSELGVSFVPGWVLESDWVAEELACGLLEFSLGLGSPLYPDPCQPRDYPKRTKMKAGRINVKRHADPIKEQRRQGTKQRSKI